MENKSRELMLSTMLSQAPCCELSGNQGQCTHIGIHHRKGVTELLRRRFPKLDGRNVPLPPASQFDMAYILALAGEVLYDAKHF